MLWVSSKDELSAAVARLSGSGYSCRSEDELSAVCERRINEIMSRSIVILVRP